MHPKKSRILKLIDKEPTALPELGKVVLDLVNHKRTVVGLKWDIKHGKVSNTHYCPEGGQTNWGGYHTKNGVPTSYTGWEGRIWVRYLNNATGFGGDPFSETLTYTGTGGFGSYDGPWSSVCKHRWDRYGYEKLKKGSYPEPYVYSWDYRFFDDDWPLIKSGVEEDRTVAMLKGVKYVEPRHTFEWYDPETIEKDNTFIEECKSLIKV